MTIDSNATEHTHSIKFRLLPNRYSFTLLTSYYCATNAPRLGHIFNSINAKLQLQWQASQMTQQ